MITVDSLTPIERSAYNEGWNDGVKEGITRGVNMMVDKCKPVMRSLWLARASEASKELNYWTCQDESSYTIVDFNVRHETIVCYTATHHRPYKWIQIWENVERKCRAYADKFKEET